MISFERVSKRYPEGHDALREVSVTIDRDELVEAGQVLRWASGLHPPPTVECMADTDHFFHGRLTLLRETVAGFLRSNAPACEVA